MTGLKSGSGDDLWDDENEEEADEGDEKPAEVQMEAGSATADQLSAGEEDNQTGKAQRTSSTYKQSAEGSSLSTSNESSDQQQQPYIVRRAIQDKSVQFERDERLTFFVHDDVADGERELTTDIESALGRSVPKFDVREAVYRAALRNREDVLEELLKMGYSTDDS